MNAIIILITLFVLLILGLTFVRYKLAIVLYLSYMILVPYLSIGPLSYNLVNAVLLCAFIFNFRIRKNMSLNFTAIKPFVFLYVWLLLISLPADTVPMSFQLHAWISNFITTCFLSFIIWNLLITDDKFIINMKWSLIISIIIAGLYAILIMRLGGANPYTSYLTSYFGQEADHAELFMESVRFRNQGTMVHPFTWAFYLSHFCIFFLISYLKERKWLYLYLLCFVVFNIIIADVRTGLASSIIALVYIYLRYNKINIRTIFYGTAIVVISVMIVLANEELSYRFLSLIDVSGTKTDISGSSFQLRFEQFNGCLDEISRSMLFGNGYGWTSYYMSIFGEHPVILAFESLIFVVLCDHGIAGVIIWLIFAFMLFRVPRKILGIKKNVYCVDGLVVFFFIYTIATGLYAWLSPFALFYTFVLGYLYNEEKKIMNLE